MKKHLIWPVILAFAAALPLAGCGVKPRVLKEYKSADESLTISMDENWKVEDMGAESWLAAFNQEETEGIVVLQLPKLLYAASIEDIEDVKGLAEESFGLSDLKTTVNPAIPGMENLETYLGDVVVDDVKGKGVVAYGETEYAFYSILYVAPRINGKKIQYFEDVCVTFKEEAPETASAVPLTDTILWFNGTCAILTKSNGWDYNIFGGIEANPLGVNIIQSLLDEWWDVTDRDTADDTMDWLLGEGHRMSFVDEMLYLEESGIAQVPVEEREGFILENYEVDQAEAQNYANWYTFYEEKGENAIGAWDYSRAMALIEDSYIAGYYTETEALDKSLELAGRIQETYPSWDAFMEAYLTGYEYWSGESSQERRKIYDEIKGAEHSPYLLEWSMALEKSW